MFTYAMYRFLATVGDEVGESFGGADGLSVGILVGALVGSIVGSVGESVGLDASCRALRNGPPNRANSVDSICPSVFSLEVPGQF